MDKAKNEIILATLEKHGGYTTFQVIMDVAEEYHCDVCSAALNSLKRKKAVEYEGMMLLLPNDADVVVSLPGKAPAGGAAPAPAPKPKPKPAPAPAPAPARTVPGPGSQGRFRAFRLWCDLPAGGLRVQVHEPVRHPVRRDALIVQKFHRNKPIDLFVSGPFLAGHARVVSEAEGRTARR